MPTSTGVCCAPTRGRRSAARREAAVRALTEALPPLSQGLVTTVAEAFRGLDEERDALRALAEARGAADEFLRPYRRYARVAAKHKAARPRQAQSRYEQLSRDLAAAEEV